MLEIATERMAKNGWRYSSGNKLSCADILLATHHFNIIKNEAMPLKGPVGAIYSKYPQLRELIAEVEVGCASYLTTREPKAF